MVNAAVIFDLDGTLTRPYLDFDAIRAEIGIASGPILEALDRMSEKDRREAEAIVERHEWEAARNSELFDGAHEMLWECRRRGHPTAILTRNARTIVDFVLRKHDLRVDAIRTREDGAIKPSPEPVLSICRQLGANPKESWMVGDFLFDILSGKSAGARTVLMIGDDELPEYAPQADFVICRLAELPGILSR
jgi:HAD superfamily hydrolase (TIGR01509 family)